MPEPAHGDAGRLGDVGEACRRPLWKSRACAGERATSARVSVSGPDSLTTKRSG